MVAELDQPGVAEPVRLLGVPIKLRAPPATGAAAGPVLGEHTEPVLRSVGYDDDAIAALKESGAVAGPVTEAQGPSSGDAATDC